MNTMTSRPGIVRRVVGIVDDELFELSERESKGVGVLLD